MSSARGIMPSTSPLAPEGHAFAKLFQNARIVSIDAVPLAIVRSSNISISNFSRFHSVI